ncbi:MAG: hypothetical protein KTR31_05155 [Myxococcales bacterium]|nr:hypothetical protein [Myxococcales bacterium]
MTWFLTVLVGCGRFEPVADVPVSSASAATVPPLPLAAAELTLEELARADVRGTAQSTTRVLQHVRALDPAQREAASAALRALQVTCPYHRSSVQLPLALRAVVSGIDPMDLDPLIQADWQRLLQGLDAQVAVLDALGVELPLPVEGDYLHGRVYPDAPLTRAQLAESGDPLADTRPLLASVPFVVDDYDDAIKGVIHGHVEVLDEATAGQWPLKLQILGWRNALKRIQPFLTDSERAARVEQMIRVIDEYEGLLC